MIFLARMSAGANPRPGPVGNPLASQASGREARVLEAGIIISMNFGFLLVSIADSRRL